MGKISNQNHRYQRQISASMAFCLLILNIFGCSQNQPNSDASQAKNVVESATKQQRFDGITITAVTFDKPIGVGVERRAREFEKLTGAKVNVVKLPIKDVFPAMQQDFENKTNKYDVVVFSPQWMTDFAQPGYLEDLTERVKADKPLAWDDIASFFREFTATYKGKVYAVPVDGDFHMVYYRTDLLERAGLEPPHTWEDYIAIANKFHGQDLNGDGKPDYGTCMAKQPKHANHKLFWSVASPFLQSQGTQQGSYFDPETMKPLVNNTAFAKALDIYKETNKYSPPEEMTLNLYQSRDLFFDGRCAMTLDWGDVGTLLSDPTYAQISDKIGALILPGSKEVLDRKTGKLVPCDKFTCPYAIDGVNHAPYGAVGGWVGGINATAKLEVKDASYALISYISQPAQSNVDVTIGITGFNPYRISQFTKRETWVKSGMKDAVVSKYLGGIAVSLKNPNMVLDLRVPENALYEREILDTALDDFLLGKKTRQETMEHVEREWEKVTNKKGRNSQIEAYRGSLGIE
jgi:multiple sugar transport system substrate-binding protein